MMALKNLTGLRAMVPAALAASLVAACGVEDRPLRTGSALMDAVGRQAEAFCKRYQECANPGLNRSYGSYDECVARNALHDHWVATLPGVAWTAETFDSCADAESRVSCETFVYHTVPQCNLPGFRAKGESCQTGDQCASLFCKTSGYGCGKCDDPLAEGESCEAKYGCGNPDLNCEGDGVCRRPSAEGEGCSDTQSCDSGLSCYQGTCTARLTNVGDTCDADLGLLCNFVEKGMSCESTQKTCFEISPKRAGESCATASYCAKAGYCSSSQICEAASNDKGACSNVDGPFCEWPAVCISGSCQLPDPESRCAGF
jgi:hypothetical protein